MSVLFRVVERGEPGVIGGGTKQFYAQGVSKGHVTLRELTAEISRMSTLSRPDVMAVLEALLELMPEKIAKGQIVQLGDFGSFFLTLRSSGSPVAQDVTSDSVIGNRLNFRPSSEIRDVLAAIKYRKASD